MFDSSFLSEEFASTCVNTAFFSDCLLIRTNLLFINNDGFKKGGEWKERNVLEYAMPVYRHIRNLHMRCRCSYRYSGISLPHILYIIHISLSMSHMYTSVHMCNAG